MAPTVLIGLSYVSLNVGSVFVDLTAVASQAFVFFTATTAYASWRVGYFSSLSVSKKRPQICHVLAIDSGPVNITVNQLIDAGCAAWGKNFCMVQSGFTSGVSVGASGPFCVFVLGSGELGEAEVRRSLGIDKENKLKIFTSKTDDLFTDEKLTSKVIEPLAWRFLSTAIVTWNEEK